MRTIAVALCALAAFPTPAQDLPVRSCSIPTVEWAADTLDQALASVYSGDRTTEVDEQFDDGAWSSFEIWTRSLVRAARSAGLSIDPSTPEGIESERTEPAGECVARLIVTTSRPDRTTDAVASVVSLVIQNDKDGDPSVSRLSLDRVEVEVNDLEDRNP